MKRLLIVLLVLVAAAAVLMLATGLVARSIVAGSGKNRVAASLGEAAGVAVSVESANFDLAQWFRFKPAISLETVAIGNPPGFAGKNLLEAQRLSAQVALWPLVRKEIRVHSIEIQQPRIFVETDARGATNIETFLKRLSSKKDGDSAGTAATLSIDELRIASGEIVVMRKRPVRIGDINVRLRDFAAGRAARLELSARLFGGQSGLQLEADAGPFSSDALPLAGKMSLTIAPAEIPPDIRKEQFGSFLAAPGRNARAGLEASVKGDVYGKLAGPATLKLTEVAIGKDEKHLLALAGEAPVEFSAERLMSDPQFDVLVRKARLRLGKGEWAGTLDFHVRGSRLSGSSTGAIRDIDINELVSNFTSAGGKIYGALEMPSYSLRFAGRNADEIKQSLDGSGKLSIAQGRITALDMLLSLQKALEGPQQESAAAGGSTPFTTFATDLNLGQQRMDLSGVLLDSPALRLAGKGRIGFDQTLNFDLDAHVTGGLARLVSRITRREQVDEANLPLVVSGTVESPRVRPNAGRLATGAVKGLFESFFGKKPK